MRQFSDDEHQYNTYIISFSCNFGIRHHVVTFAICLDHSPSFYTTCQTGSCASVKAYAVQDICVTWICVSTSGTLVLGGLLQLHEGNRSDNAPDHQRPHLSICCTHLRAVEQSTCGGMYPHRSICFNPSFIFLSCKCLRLFVEIHFLPTWILSH